MTLYRDLDQLLHSQLRLAIISILMNADAAEFTFIKDQTGATPGNLSIQITKLKEAGYIEVEKRFYNNYPQTLCRITSLGRERFEEYVKNLREYLTPGK